MKQVFKLAQYGPQMLYFLSKYCQPKRKHPCMPHLKHAMPPLGGPQDPAHALVRLPVFFPGKCTEGRREGGRVDRTGTRESPNGWTTYLGNAEDGSPANNSQRVKLVRKIKTTSD